MARKPIIENLLPASRSAAQPTQIFCASLTPTLVRCPIVLSSLTCNRPAASLLAHQRDAAVTRGYGTRRKLPDPIFYAGAEDQNWRIANADRFGIV